MSQLYWGVVRASITDAGREYEGPLNEWWSYEHMPDFVALEGFRRGWRLRTIEHESAIGDPDQLYSAAYEIESVDAFSAALEAFHPPWGPWQEHIDDWLIDWSRTYYRLLGTFDEQSDDGGYWAIVRASLSLDGPDQEQEFNDWYTNTHMPEICDNPGGTSCLAARARGARRCRSSEPVSLLGRLPGREPGGVRGGSCPAHRARRAAVGRHLAPPARGVDDLLPRDHAPCDARERRGRRRPSTRGKAGGLMPAEWFMVVVGEVDGSVSSDWEPMVRRGAPARDPRVPGVCAGDEIRRGGRRSRGLHDAVRARRSPGRWRALSSASGAVSDRSESTLRQRRGCSDARQSSGRGRGRDEG